MNYFDIGRQEGAEALTGGYYIEPNFVKGNNKMRAFQEEIFGLVVSA